MKAEEVLALVSGRVDEELLLHNEYLAAENEILRSKLKKRVPLTDYERIRLATLGKRLGQNALSDVATIVTPRPFFTGTDDLFRRSTTGPQTGARSAGHGSALR